VVALQVPQPTYIVAVADALATDVTLIKLLEHVRQLVCVSIQQLAADIALFITVTVLHTIKKIIVLPTTQAAVQQAALYIHAVAAVATL
jgi:hypothetical protein